MEKDDLSHAMQLAAIKRTFEAVAIRIAADYEAKKATLGLCSLTSKEAIGTPGKVEAYRQRIANLRTLTADFKGNVEKFIVELTRHSLALLAQRPPDSARLEADALQSVIQFHVTQTGLLFDSMQRWMAASSEFLDVVEPYCQLFVFEPGNTYFPSNELLERCRPLMQQIQQAHEQQVALQLARRQRMSAASQPV